MLNVTEKNAFAKYPQQPHGGKLVDRVVVGQEREEELIRAKQLPTIMVDMEAVITLEMIVGGTSSGRFGSRDINRAEHALRYLFPLALFIAGLAFHSHENKKN